MKPTAALLFSGGIDSTTLLYLLMERGISNIHTITFDYGQRHKIEIKATQQILADITNHHPEVHVHSELIDVSEAFSFMTMTDHPLVNLDLSITPGPYSNQTVPSSVVPGRNLIFLALGASYCEAHKIPDLYYAIHANDSVSYPDCRRPFHHDVSNAIKQSTVLSPVTCLAPYMIMSKANIITLGLRLGVPYHLTWSCYNPTRTGDLYRPCGVCATCIERQEAFKAAGTSDPSTGLRR